MTGERSLVHEQVIARLLGGWLPESGHCSGVQQWFKPGVGWAHPYQTQHMEDEHAELIERVRRERLS